MRLKTVLTILTLIGIIIFYSYIRFAFNIPYGFILDKAVIIVSAIMAGYLIFRSINNLLVKIFSKTPQTNALAKKLFPLINISLKIFVGVLLALYTLSLLGINISTLLTGAGIGGFFMAMAGKEAAANFLGSLNLIFSKKFKIGDQIKVKDFEGKVEEITLNGTRLLSKKGSTIFVPNKNIISETIENLSESKFIKISFTTSFSLTIKAKEMKEILEYTRKTLDKKVEKGECIDYELYLDNLSEQSYLVTTKIKINLKDKNKEKPLTEEVLFTLKEKAENI